MLDLEKRAWRLEDGAVYNGNYGDSLGLKVSEETGTKQYKFPVLFIGITKRTNMMPIDSGKSFAIQYCERGEAPEML